MEGGFTNYAWSGDGLSVPFRSEAGSEFISQEDEEDVRRLLREVFPQFANRTLTVAHLCLFADTADSDYIIDFIPGTGTSLIVLSRDSGHGFKMLPIFGDFVQNLLEKGTQSEPKWQWKESKPKSASA